MDALQCYESNSDSDSENGTERGSSRAKKLKPATESTTNISSGSSLSLPPPPPEFFSFSPDPGTKKGIVHDHGGRVRIFPHVAGNYALHVYIPVTLSSATQNKLAPYLQKAVSMFPSLKSMEDDDLPANVGSKQGVKLSTEFHISLGRTVPIRIYQADTVVPMLRRKFGGQKRFLVEFGSWEVFVNDDHKRSFLSLEVVAAGVLEIKRQVSLVDDVYRLHDLPTFYENPRPHISLAWALGDVSEALANVARDLNSLARSQDEMSRTLTSGHEYLSKTLGRVSKMPLSE